MVGQKWLENSITVQLEHAGMPNELASQHAEALVDISHNAADMAAAVEIADNRGLEYVYENMTSVGSVSGYVAAECEGNLVVEHSSEN